MREEDAAEAASLATAQADYDWAMRLTAAIRDYQENLGQVSAWTAYVKTLWDLSDVERAVARERYAQLTHVQRTFGYGYNIAAYLLSGVWYLQSDDATAYVYARVRALRDRYIRSVPGWTYARAHLAWGQDSKGLGALFEALDADIYVTTSAFWREPDSPQYVAWAVVSTVHVATSPMPCSEDTLWHLGVEDLTDAYARARIALALRLQQELLITIRARARFFLSQSSAEYSDQYGLALKYLDKFLGWPEP